MKLLATLLGALALLFVALLIVPGCIEPVTWTPAPRPALAGDFETNAILNRITPLLEGEVTGPEDIAQAPNGDFVTGLADGRILRFNAKGRFSVMGNTGGRPLGLQFSPNGSLIIADADKGLLAMDANGQIKLLADEYQGKKMRFVDDLDIAGDGTIWFSDVSTRFGVHDTMLDLLEGSATGRLFSFNPSNQELTLHADKLFFANGVALGPDERFVLVNETGRGTIKRLWLKGEKKGEIDTFHTGLPGHPDNISFNGNDIFWVAMPSPRTPLFDKLAAWPRLRKLLAYLPESLMPADVHASMIVGLGINGEVLFNLQSKLGAYYYITSVNQYNDKLYIGSLENTAVGVLPLSELP